MRPQEVSVVLLRYTTHVMTPYFIAIAVPLVLLVLFLALVAVEERRGRRLFFPGRRYALDLKAERAAFVIQHVDWGAFTSDLARTSFERLAHDLAHTTLIFVRALERQLTKLVRVLRARRDQHFLPQRSTEKPTRMESAISYLKRTVYRSRKHLPEAQDRSGSAE